jgi:hypothetical protein
MSALGRTSRLNGITTDRSGPLPKESTAPISVFPSPDTPDEVGANIVGNEAAKLFIAQSGY